MYLDLTAKVVLTACAVLLCSTVSADVYRWVDEKTGEIFFSETPPSPDVATEYENVTHKLNAKGQQQSKSNSNSTMREDINSDEQVSNEEVISDDALLSKRRCDTFAEQITRLERTIPETTDPQEMDNLIVKLVDYEKAYKERCL
ncbi:MAG: DUF4124 domain-containing protein [Pseudomonadota bacterium]